MHIRCPAILLAIRQHGETAVVARFFTADAGVVAAYVAGGRGRTMRPVLIPGNDVQVDISSRAETQLPFARVELLGSRGPFLTEPLAAAAIGWVTALTASALPERQPYPAVQQALGALLAAICHAPSARGWAVALAGYESLLLRDLGYGSGEQAAIPHGDLAATLAALDELGQRIDHYLLAERRSDVMAARNRLRDLLGRML